MTKRKTHYKVFGVCISFIAACTLEWCYDCGLWEAPWTEDEKEVTCKKCLRRLLEWKRTK